MIANQERFDALIHKLEIFANKQPRTYRLHVAFLATLGYTYIFLILAATLGLSVGLVLLMLNSQRISSSAIKGSLFLLAFAFVLLRSLWVAVPPPDGLRLQLQDAPELYRVVNEIASQLKAPRFHHILLTDDFNAGVIQRPRLGLLGWYSNYLIVGLPLMLALSPEQFRAVIAHELGHLSGNHSRFGGWIYRQRYTWYRLIESLEQGGNQFSLLIFDWFLKLYVPFFNAYSFVLARRNEYEADKCAVDITGVQNTAEMLISVGVKSRFLQNNFWSDVYQQIQTEIEPPSKIYAQMEKSFLQEINRETTDLYLKVSLAEETNNADTHPCLKDRLRALGYIPYAEEDIDINMSITNSAANEFLGESLIEFVEHFNQAWRERTAIGWRQKHTEIQESRATLTQLQQKAQEEQLTIDESLQLAFLTLDFESESAALPILEEIVVRKADHVSANYLLGQLLLKRQDKQGIEYIERAIAKDTDAVIDGCRIIYDFLQQQGNLEQAQSYRQRAEEHYELMLKAEAERSTIRNSDEFLSHNLPESEVNKLRQQLSGYPQITTAYLTRKVVQFFPDKPLYVMGVVRKNNFWKFESESANSELANALSQNIEFPYPAFFVVLNNNPKIEKKFQLLSNATILNH
jgi:Zn-dependent protease with chaperone function